MPLERSAIDQSYSPGDLVGGKYRLSELLGSGGMGEVWGANNVALDAPVAIKLIRQELHGARHAGRLLREARAAARLAHPAIIRVFDLGKTERGEPYVVMEWLHGETLASLASGGGLSAVVIVQALLPILDALQLAHARDLVHRDVKPDNIFLADVGNGQVQPKLLDFGLVQARDYDRALTSAGVVVGCPPYMSPEQARGTEELDHQADLWALCVTLYQCVSGTLPFEGANYHALIRSIVEDEAPRLPGTGPVLSTLASIIAKGLSKDRAERFQSAEELGRALARWLRDQGVQEDMVGVNLAARWSGSMQSAVALLPASATWGMSASAVRASRSRLGRTTPRSGFANASGSATTQVRKPPHWAPAVGIAMLAGAGVLAVWKMDWFSAQESGVVAGHALPSHSLMLTANGVPAAVPVGLPSADSSAAGSSSAERQQASADRPAAAPTGSDSAASGAHLPSPSPKAITPPRPMRSSPPPAVPKPEADDAESLGLKEAY